MTLAAEARFRGRYTVLESAVDSSADFGKEER
jgi:hypothetical protein